MWVTEGDVCSARSKDRLSVPAATPSAAGTSHAVLSAPNGRGKTPVTMVHSVGAISPHFAIQELLDNAATLEDWSLLGPDSANRRHTDAITYEPLSSLLQRRGRIHRHRAWDAWLAEGDRLLGQQSQNEDTRLLVLRDLVTPAQCTQLHVASPEGFASTLRQASDPQPLETVQDITVAFLQLMGRGIRYGRQREDVQFNALRIERSAAHYRALRGLSRYLFVAREWAEPTPLPLFDVAASEHWTLACGVLRLTVPLVPRAPGRVPPGLNTAWWDCAGVPSGGATAA